MIEVTAERESDVYLVGRRNSPHVQDLRDFLSRNRVAFGWVDLDHDPLVRALGARVPDGLRLPVFVYADGSVSEWPAGDDDQTAYNLARAQLAERVGLHTRPDKDLYDVVIVGAGPAGLTAAVYAASEGLDTVVVELHAPGGQAGTSSRIENYPGFPNGISGNDLAEAAFDQAVRFGAEFVIGCDFTTATADEDGNALPHARQRCGRARTRRNRSDRFALSPPRRAGRSRATRCRRVLRVGATRGRVPPRRPCVRRRRRELGGPGSPVSRRVRRAT